MSKVFHGRVLFAGSYEGKAVVSHQGFNTLASYQSSLLKKNAKKVIVSDQNNKDLYQLEISDVALCLPQTIGSTTGGLVLQTAARRDLAPKAMLFSEAIDPLAASGVILSNVWENKELICIDSLGEEFLNTVKTGSNIKITPEGDVIVLEDK